MMKYISAETTVGELVRAVPGRARVFENLGIDYCCGGKKSLGEVCRAKNLDPATVIAKLAGPQVSDNLAVATEYDWHRDAAWDPFAKVHGLV